jgi:hypothetical protein
MSVDDLMDMVLQLQRRVDRLEAELSNPAIAARNRFKRIPPKVEEIAERMRERNITSFTAESFHAFYESKGWRIGSAVMKNWDAALTTWANRATPSLPLTKSVKFYSYNEICQMALTSNSVWQEYVSLQLPDRPRPVWAHINDATTNNLIQYKI